MFTLYGLLELYGIFPSALTEHLTFRTILNADITLIVTAFGVGYLSNKYRISQEQMIKDKDNLTSSNQRLNSLITSSPLAIISINEDNIVYEWNPAAEKTFGWKTEEILGKILPIIDEDRKIIFSSKKKFVVSNNSDSTFEILLTRKDGSIFLAKTSLTLIKKFSDNGNHFLIITEDISEKKKNEQELINSRNRAVALADASFEGITIISEGKLVDHNHQIATMLGYDAVDILNKNYIDFIHPKYHPIVLDSIKNDRKQPYEIELIKKDGSLLTVEVRGRTIEIDGKNVRLTAIRDISQSKLDALKNKILFNIANAAVTSSSFVELCEMIREYLKVIIPVDNFYIALYNKETDLISFPYFIDKYTKAPEPRKPGKGLTEYILRSGEPIIATKDVLHELNQKGELDVRISKDGFYERIGVPLKYKEEVIGVLAIKNYDIENHLDKNSLDILIFTSNQIATAVVKKLSEEKLAVQLNFFNSMLEHFPDSIYLKDKNSKFISVSKSFVHKAGLNSTEAIIGKSDFDIFDEKHAKDAYNDEQKIIQTGIPLIGKEEVEIWPDGKETYVITTKMPWFDVDGNIVGTFGIAYDITNRKMAEIERDRFFNISLDLLCIAGFDGYFKRINPAFEKISGFSIQELLDKPILDFIHPDDRENTYNMGKNLIENEPIRNYETRFLCKDGSYKWFLWASVPYGNSIYAAAHDITERKKYEISLVKSEKTLKELNVTKDKFFSILAHDLRSPYQGLIGLLDFMLNYYDTLTSSEVFSNLETLNKIVHNQFALLEDLLHWGRLQGGNAKFNPKKNDLCEVTRESVLFLNSSIVNKELNVELFIPDDCNIIFDYNMLSVVLRNLLSNAIKFSHPGSKIEILISKNHNDIKLSIKDYGIGIKSEMLNKLFKLENTFSTYGTNNETGSGLGLILCYEIIKKHNGRIEVESIEKKGSTFTIILNENFLAEKELVHES